MFGLVWILGCAQVEDPFVLRDGDYAPADDAAGFRGLDLITLVMSESQLTFAFPDETHERTFTLSGWEKDSACFSPPHRMREFATPLGDPIPTEDGEAETVVVGSHCTDADSLELNWFGELLALVRVEE